MDQKKFYATYFYQYAMLKFTSINIWHHGNSQVGNSTESYLVAYNRWLMTSWFTIHYKINNEPCIALLCNKIVQPLILMCYFGVIFIIVSKLKALCEIIFWWLPTLSNNQELLCYMTIMNRSTIGTEIPIPHYLWSTCAGSDNMGKRIVMRLTQNRCEEVFFLQ